VGYIGTGGLRLATREPLAGPGILWDLEELGATAVRVSYVDAHGHALTVPPRRDARSSWEELDLRYRDSHRSVRSVGGGLDRVRIRYRLAGRVHTLYYLQQDVRNRGSYPPLLDRLAARGIDGYIEKAAWDPAMDWKDRQDPERSDADLLGPVRAALWPHLDGDHAVIVTDRRYDHRPLIGAAGARLERIATRGRSFGHGGQPAVVYRTPPQNVATNP
jgi:hypothetical protein